MKKIIITAFILTTSLTSLHTHAQEEFLPIEPDQDTKQMPQLYAHDLVLNGARYHAGDLISGTFFITNVIEDTVAADISYQVQLVGEFDTYGFPLELFNSSENRDSLTIGNNTKSVNFAYQLPDNVPVSDLGIQIQLFTDDGLPLTRTAEQVDILGSSVSFLEYEYFLLIGEDELFFPLEGPQVRDGEEVRARILLNNSGNSDAVVQANVKVYSGNTSGQEVQSFIGSPIEVRSGGEIDDLLILPTFNYKPGIYTAVVEYKDQQTNSVLYTGPMEFRYLVDGLTPQIESASINQFDENNPKGFGVVVEFGSVPYDLRYSEAEVSDVDDSTFPENVSARVSILDENKQVIDEGMVLFNNQNFVEDISFAKYPDTENLNIRVQLFKDGSEIDNRDYVFEIEIPTYNSILMGSANTLILIIIAIILIFLAAAIGKRKSRATKEI